jgi:hypothetical protein
MPEGLHVANPLPSGDPLLGEDGTADEQWRQSHEVRSLLDMLQIYRRCVADLATENTMLHEQVATLRAIAASATAGPARHRRGFR